MSSHPLSLLTADEISAATIAVRESLRLKTTSNVIKALRWIDVSLEEPETEAERNALLSDPHAQRLGSSSRRARVTVYDSTDNMTYEAIVALIHRAGGRVDARGAARERSAVRRGELAAARGLRGGAVRQAGRGDA